MLAFQGLGTQLEEDNGTHAEAGNTTKVLVDMHHVRHAAAWKRNLTD